MLEVKGLEEAVKDFNEWNDHAEIKYSLETGRVWCVEYLSDNEWINDDEDVFVLYSKSDTTGLNDVSLEELSELITTLVKSGESLEEIKEFYKTEWHNVAEKINLRNVVNFLKGVYLC